MDIILSKSIIRVLIWGHASHRAATGSAFASSLTGLRPFVSLARSDFDITPNDNRDPLEVSDWWGRPFILTESWDDNAESWEDHVERLKDYPDMDLGTQEAYEEKQAGYKTSWFKTYSTGVRYEVCCLDGGAWDRSTVWGMVGSLEQAMEIIKKRS